MTARASDMRGWVQLGLGVAALLGAAAAGWAAMSSRHAEAVVRIGHVEAGQERLRALPAAVAEIQAEQRAQRAMLERIDRRLESLSRPK